MVFTDLFIDIADFRKYADGLDADTSYHQISASIRSAGKEVMNIISQPVYAAVSSLDELSEGKRYLKAAGNIGQNTGKPISIKRKSIRF